MVDVDMGIHDRVAEETDIEAGFLGENLRQECVRREIERDPQRDIARSLRQMAIQGAREDIESKSIVTGGSLLSIAFPGSQAVTTIRRELGSVLRSSITRPI